MKISLTVNKEFLINFSMLIGNMNRRTALIQSELKRCDKTIFEKSINDCQSNIEAGNQCLGMLEELQKLENFNLCIGEN